MPDWTAFGAVTVVLTLLVLTLARATQRALETSSEPASAPSDAESAAVPSDDPAAAEESVQPQPEALEPTTPQQLEPTNGLSLDAISTRALLANVAGTQLFVLLLLLGGIWYAEVPLSALGVSTPTGAELGIGAALGVVLFGLNQLAARLGRQFGLSGNEELRGALAPESLPGWLALLFLVLPVVAGVEELLFRGALVGGLAAGFGLSPWLLVVASSFAFGLGHGAQGRVGVVVTALLGGVFGVAFVVTGSFWLVAVAHYLVNALEFVVCEGIRT